MKRKALVALAVLGSIQCGYAQKSIKDQLPQRLFTEGQEMFYDNNYVGCEHSLNEFKMQSDDKNLNIEADYMIVCSQYFEGREDAGNLLKSYLDDNPETPYRNQLCFYIGSTCFNQKDWKRSLYWFDQSNVDYLSLTEQDDYAFRLAYASLEDGKRTDAERLFGLLSRNSKKYGASANYYLAYIDFQNGNYDKALPVFERLKNNPTYREQAQFYIVQGEFLKNDLEKTISEGEDYLKTYSNSKNRAEVYRMLGNAYSRTQNVSASISNYEKYRTLAPNPIREDMYLLGTDYYKVEAYLKAVDAFKLATGTADKLGQDAYMQLGQSYLKTGDNANALMAFDAASRVDYDPTVSEMALYNYALMVNKTSMSFFDQSVTVFERFLTKYPHSKYADQVNETLAASLLSTKNYAEGLTVINGINNPGRQLLAAKQMMLYQLGTQSFVNGNYDEATKNFNSSINMGNYDTKAKNEAYFWRGETAYRKENYSSAIGDYKTYLGKIDSSSDNYGLALYGLGYSYFKTKQYGDASSFFKSYVTQERNFTKPSYADALNRLGDCALFARNYLDASNYYARALNTNPSNADYSEFQKAFVLGLQRNYAGKVKSLDEMMNKYPNSQYIDNALFEKSRALVMMNREADAIPVLNKLLTNFPQSPIAPKAGVQLGQLYFNNNNPQKSIEAYKTVIEKYPNTDAARVSITSLEGVYKDINDVNSYATYVNSLGNGVVVTPTRQDSLNYLAAEGIYLKGQKANAQVAMTKYLQAYPNGIFASDAHFHLGSIAFEAKDKSTALSEFERVIVSNNPKYMNDALIYASGIEFENKKYENAYSYYKQLAIVATSAENKNTAQLGMLRCASILQKDNDVIPAATSLIADPKTSPEVLSEARYYRGLSYLKMNQKEKAIADLTLTAKDTRTVSGAQSQYLLADTYFKAKEYDKVQKQVNEFMKLGTPHEYWMARALIVLSDSYAAKGDKFQAKQYLESLKANYKGSEPDIQSMIAERLK